jgi:anti-sigma factor RsiW
VSDVSDPAVRHLDALTLDALALGALAPPDAAATLAHLESCTACRAEADTAAALRAHFERSVLARTLPRVARRRPWWLLVAPLAIFLVTRDRQGDTDTDNPVLGIKGESAWQVFANRNGATFAVRDGAPLAAGDRIRFVVTPAGARYLLIASIDGTGATTIYYPYGGNESAAVSGDRIELPGSIVLDAAAGPERLYAVFSNVPVSADAIKSELGAIGPNPTEIRRPHHLDVLSRAQLSLVFEKAQP